MSIEELKKYKCDDYGKNFTQNIGLRGHITWKKDSIVMNVANIFYRESNLRVHIQIVHEKDF